MARRTIKLYYWKRPDGLNFGDELSPLIFEYASGQKCEYASPRNADVLAIGSVMHMLSVRKMSVAMRLAELFRARETISLWGTGTLRKTALSFGRLKLSVHAVRGKLTAGILGHPTNLFGDPALLIRDLFQERRKQYAVGIVPHHIDEANAAVQELAHRVGHSKIISVNQPPLDVVREISECECVLSSSLHGLIVADALEVPNARLVFSGNLVGDWKFRDYASGVGRESIEPLDHEALGSSISMDLFDTSHLANIPRVVERLRSACPFRV